MLLILGISLLCFVQTNAARCGILDTSSRIVGGEDTGGTRYPWFALLRLKNEFRQPFCGGSLITYSHVLTAAHCFGVFPDRENKDKFIVDLNIYDRCDDNEEGRESYDLAAAYVNQDFNGQSDPFNDIAVVMINETTSLPLVCLPPPSDGSRLTEPALILGYGYLQEGGPEQPCHLMQSSVQKLSREDCLKTDVPENICNNNSTFAGGADGTGTCQGDSGGPFLTFTSDGRFIATGIVSFGFGCARENLPEIYTNVASFIDWIEEQIGTKLDTLNEDDE